MEKVNGRLLQLEMGQVRLMDEMEKEKMKPGNEGIEGGIRRKVVRSQGLLILRILIHVIG